MVWVWAIEQSQIDAAIKEINMGRESIYGSVGVLSMSNNREQRKGSVLHGEWWKYGQQIANRQ